ncbi:MAG: PP2C family protein-serine/threonine phosphatase [Planctomycetia bacterium]
MNESILPVETRSLTDVGMKRSHNQDDHAVVLASTEAAWRTRGHLFVVADGMGAHAVGELASKLAVQTIVMSYTKLAENTPPSEALDRAVTEANNVVHEKGQLNAGFEGMGTTGTALAITEKGAFIGHVGDSRCYRVRGKRIEQLSYDHSLQWEMARRANRSPNSMTDVPKNVIIRSLGPQAQVKVDVTGPYSVEPGDYFLLCSDGLSGPVRSDELWAAATCLSPDEAVRYLVDLANLRGGNDNITVVLAHVPKEESPAAEPWWKPAGAKRRAKELYLFLRRLTLPERLLAAGLLSSLLDYTLLYFRSGYALMSVFVSLGLLSASLGIMIYRRNAAPIGPRGLDGPPPVYFPTDVELGAELTERVAQMMRTLREMAVEQSWKIDFAKLDQFRAAGEEHCKAGQWIQGYAEYCRGVSVLATAVRDQRRRDEVFKSSYVGEG